MVADFSSFILGSSITIFASASLCLNIAVLWTLWRHKFLTNQHDGIFILAFANMSGNAFALFVYGAYLGPMAITQSYLFSSLYPFPKFIGAAWHVQWYQDMLLMAFTAINRWIVVVKPPYLPVFTRTHTMFFIIFAYSAGIFITILATYVLPCCMLYFEYVSMSFAYFVDGPNDTDHFLDYPVNVTCMTVAVLCYIRIYFFVRSSNIKIMSNLPKSAAENRKAKETKYAFQFAACTFCVIGFSEYEL
uniref:7TM GPCR serpentine receptor class x (Srx) domain-containing protein n=1 Tax=Panagrolaimus davidi TaxID=227884 RepID=A0A914Q0C6_9BILA